MLHDPELHYLDNAATTIVAPEVADVIDKAMREHWANPSSLYAPGARSEEALNAARAAVARTLGCKSKELYFTSCGSESNNLALLGAVRTRTFRAVGGFDEKYFMYVEDADLTQKMRTQGKAYLVPQFTAIHAWHRAAHRSLKPALWQTSNLLRYFSKWGFRW